MVLHHVDVPSVSLILLQHIVPNHILTGPAVKTMFDTMVKLLLSFCTIKKKKKNYDLYEDKYFSTRQNMKCGVKTVRMLGLHREEEDKGNNAGEVRLRQ